MATNGYNRPLHWYSIFTAVATFFLIVAGGLVTSNDAGLAVPDWPLSFGRLMPEMTGGVFYEHGHRMIAATVGLLTVILAIWVSLAESRSWVRKLGWAAVATVILQGLLGGLTVLLKLPVAVSVVHACLAQTFFGLVTALAFVLSSPFVQFKRPTGHRHDQRLMLWSFLGVGAVFLQLVLGALVRHAGTADGSKAAHPVTSALLAHIGGALLVTLVVVILAVMVLRYEERLEAYAYLILSLLLGQLVLGVGAYLARTQQGGLVEAVPPVILTTGHVAVGALLLVSLLILALQLSQARDTDRARSLPGQALTGEA